MAADSKFHFVAVQWPPDQKSTSVARSHAVTQGLAKKRTRLRRRGQVFRFTQTLENTDQRAEASISLPLPCSLSSVSDRHTTDSPRLQAMLQQWRKPYSPVFNMFDELVLRNLEMCLQTGTDNAALQRALVLTFTLASTIHSPATHNINCKFLELQNDTIHAIRKRILLPNGGAHEPTIGAILLLAYAEARLGRQRQVELHMSGIRQILEICSRQGVRLSDGIKRAIFWSDLNASVMTGSNRVVDHTTFHELRWQRDSKNLEGFSLPPGFQPHIDALGPTFIEIIEDIFALQCIRNSTFLSKESVTPMTQIDNHQASIQSRLACLITENFIAECCFTAVYLCSTMLRCKIWRESAIPSCLSLKLLAQLQRTNDNPAWNQHPGLFAWMLYIGGAFATEGPVQSGYVELLHESRKTMLKELYLTWEGLVDNLQQFIWSENAFEAQIHHFWELTSQSAPTAGPVLQTTVIT